MSVIAIRRHSLLSLLIYKFQHKKPRYDVKLRCAKCGRDETKRYTTSHYDPEFTLSTRKFQTTLWCCIIFLYKNEGEMEVTPTLQGSPSKNHAMIPGGVGRRSTHTHPYPSYSQITYSSYPTPKQSKTCKERRGQQASKLHNIQVKSVTEFLESGVCDHI